MLTVALVCVPGGIYDDSHIRRMVTQVEDYLECDHMFHVIRESDKPGWWAKIDLFQPGSFTGRVLYLDLDITIVGGLDEVATFDAPFAAIPDYTRFSTLNSSVMVWDVGYCDHIYKNFTPDVMDTPGGDQAWITKQMPMARKFPRRWFPSYKLHVEPTGRIPDGAKAVIYHGQPKPWSTDA